MSHLRLAAASEPVLRGELIGMVKATPFLIQALRVARDLKLPDCWLVSGAIYNMVWNRLTNRPLVHGVKDIDLFYFDPDTSYDAEDKVIRRASKLFQPDPPVEVRNQARVHLWYRDHFGQPYPPLSSAREGIDRFACKTHAIGLRLGGGGEVELYAPYGLRDIFSFRLTPNPLLNNRATHEAKAARQTRLWPELTVPPWPDEPA